MTTIVTRSGKGSALTHSEVDANFTNLNTYKVEQDANGNIAINATLAGWDSGQRVYQNKNAAVYGYGSDSGTLVTNAYYNSGWKRISAGYATQYLHSSGSHIWNIAATGAANSALTWTQAMTLDGAGSLLRGTATSPFGGDQTGYVNSNGTQISTWGVSSSYGGTFIGSYSNHDLGLIANNSTKFKIYANGDTLNHGGGGLGYGTGSGGAVTQLTSKSATVVLNKPAGQITTHNAALAANTVVAFNLSNTSIGPNDTVAVIVKSGAAGNGTYNVWAEQAASGSATVCIRNITGGSLSEALVLNFTVTKGSAS